MVFEQEKYVCLKTVPQAAMKRQLSLYGHLYVILYFPTNIILQTPQRHGSTSCLVSDKGNDAHDE